MLRLLLVNRVVVALGQSAFRQAQHIQFLDQHTISVTFGSCYGKTNYESDIFTKIAPLTDLFIWLGDSSYVSSPNRFKESMPPEYVIGRLNETKATPGYSQLKRVIGTWDDHDFGKNDGGKTFIAKKQYREIYLDFIGEIQDSERRVQNDSPIH